MSLAGRTCVVTGASSGIGKATARELARQGARVVLACRSAERGEDARRSLVADTGNDAIELMLVDVSHQASLREFARAYREQHRDLHVLVNNAGVWSNRRQESREQIELTWATNVLGYFLLTELLTDRLRDSAPSRVVNVASELAGELDLTDVEFKRRRYRGVAAYSQSKQADRMLTWALARRLSGTGVTANALHPGTVNTPLFAAGGGMSGMAGAVYAKAFGKSPEEGADTVVYLAASPDVEGVSGAYWIDRREVPCRFRDEASEEALWTLCESMTGRPVIA